MTAPEFAFEASKSAQVETSAAETADIDSGGKVSSAHALLIWVLMSALGWLSIVGLLFLFG